jgi:uncharacterized protein YbjT (DUF2867 family)
MIKNKYLQNIRICAVAGVLTLAGCATVNEPWRGDGLVELPAVRQCAESFTALDAAIDRAGVRDAEAHRLPGFPYLRVDRFSAHLRDVAGNDDQAYTQWVSRLQALDRAARRVEISNLADAEVRALQRDSGGRAALTDSTARCADMLRDQDMKSPSRAALIRVRAQVPDDYVTWQRVVGLYGLTRIPFSKGIVQWQSDALRDFRSVAAGREPEHPLMRYAAANPQEATRAQIAAAIRRASDNPLRIPQFSNDERALLVDAFAPVFEVETGGPYDRIGRLRWGSDAAPEVDTVVPVVYHRIAYTRYGDRTLTQIVYTAWFPERPPDHALDMLAGRLDGVVMRVTLSPDGDPLLYDSMHPCGCYHMFFATPRVQAVPAPGGEVEWAFVPATLPLHGAGERIAVRVATRSHYLLNVTLDPPGATHGYTLLSEDELRTLPLPDRERRTPQDNGTRSAYGPDGQVPGTERGERMFFWPMGIPSAGAMRQWGHHATAFVGRRHFDDADLIEKRFRIVAP